MGLIYNHMPKIRVVKFDFLTYSKYQHDRFRCSPLARVQGRSLLFTFFDYTDFDYTDFDYGGELEVQTKAFKTVAEQINLLRGRGMCITDQARAERLLARLNYYRLSGYWYPMRRFANGQAQNEFVAAASFDLVVSLYEFDERLRVGLL